MASGAASLEADLALSASSPIRAMLADGHPLMRRSLRDLLDVEVGVAIATEADDPVSAEDEVRLRQLHVLAPSRGANALRRSTKYERARAPDSYRLLGLTPKAFVITASCGFPDG